MFKNRYDCDIIWLSLSVGVFLGLEPIIDYLLGSEEPTQIHKNKRTGIALTTFHIFYVGTIWDG